MTLMSAIKKGFKLELAYKLKDEHYMLEMHNKHSNERLKLIERKEKILKIYGIDRLNNHLAF